MKKTLFFIAIASLFTTGAFAQQYPGWIKLAIRPDQQINGELRWEASSQKYAITYRTPGGTGNTTMRYSPNEIIELRVQKPANFDQLMTQVRGATPDTAIPGLTQIVTNYKMLEWDANAANVIATIHNKARRWEETIKLGDKVTDENPGAASTSILAPLYWTAMLRAGSGKNINKISGWIDTAVATAPRPVAAAALNVRGDMLKAAKKPKEALAEGYLRAALMYTNERDANAEALYKAAETFDEIGQTSYAEKMRDRLFSYHRSSTWAKSLQGGN